MAIRIAWSPKTTPRELHSLLKECAIAYPIAKDSDGMNVSFVRSADANVCNVNVTGNTARIEYGSLAQAGRGIGSLLAGLGSSKTKTPFKSLGIMLDCSRNAVMTVEHVRVWLRRLALLGYNVVMLYTEDTYDLPDEPYFGYKRGAYSAKELSDIDHCAAHLGIEVIPCIQTLGHMGQVLRHPAYNSIKDTPDVMLVDEKKTYQLIDKMLRHWKSVSKTRRIHIGMDETHSLGRGRYLDQNGYKNGFDLFNQHLKKVVALCKKHGLQPMIWSDMYFRLGSKVNGYYDTQSVTPPRVIRNIPKAVEFVYWDYYHDKESFYREWIERHRHMGKPPLMGSGIWTWDRYWYDHKWTVKTAGPCIDACRKENIDEIFFTQWGDNGAYCDHDSAFAGMAYCAERAYGSKKPKSDILEKRFQAVCGGSYQAHILASAIHGCSAAFQPNMWDDPIFETHFRTHANDSLIKMRGIAKRYDALADQLRQHRRDRAVGDLKHAYCVARAFAERYGFCTKLLSAYRKKDKKALHALVSEIALVRKSIGAMAKSFRDMWMRHNKPEGIEVIQGRFGMLDARYQELAQRLQELLRGDIVNIAELEYRCPPRSKKK